MKKIFKTLGIVLLLLIVVALIAGLFLRKDYHFEKTITISAPPDSVWQHIHSLQALNTWSPWLEKDPKIVTHYEGKDGEIGARFSWKGNKEVGIGSQQISAIEPNKKIETALMFQEPFESEMSAGVYLEAGRNGTETKVTWTMDTEFPYPMNVTMLFMSMDASMDKDYTAGLTKLKKICEKKS